MPGPAADVDDPGLRRGEMPAEVPVDYVGPNPAAEGPVMSVDEPVGDGRPGVVGHRAILTR
jgi:hypothetical protein